MDAKSIIEEKCNIIISTIDLIGEGYDSKAYIVNKGMKEISLKLGELTDDERTIITSGCLINYYRDH